MAIFAAKGWRLIFYLGAIEVAICTPIESPYFFMHKKCLFICLHLTTNQNDLKPPFWTWHFWREIMIKDSDATSLDEKQQGKRAGFE